MQIESLSAVVFTSPDPQRLAAFYATHLGIPFEREAHGPMRNHFEATVFGLHFAVLKGGAPQHGGVSPTFKVRNLDVAVADLTAAGSPPTRPPFAIDDDKRIAMFTDPDGNRFALIELTSHAA